MADITSNLVAWYKLDETSGTTCADSSGNGYHGTYVNSPTLNQTGAFAASRSVAFSRESVQHVTLGSRAASTDMSVALWLSRASNAVYRTIHIGYTLMHISNQTQVVWFHDLGGANSSWTVAPLGTGVCGIIS